MSKSLGLYVTVAVLLASVVPAGAAENDFVSLVDQHAKSLVTVKFVMKMKMGGESQEVDAEAPGMMIQPDGLVICSNTLVGGVAGMLRRMSGQRSGPSSEPTNLKVLIGPEEDEYDAELIIRDTELDLAWVKITDEAKKKKQMFDATDLSKSAVPTLGQNILCLRRMSKYFDRVPIVQKGTICAYTEKPRKLWVPNLVLSSEVGSPVFDTQGRPLGLIVMQIPEADELGGPDRTVTMSSARRDPATGKILPAMKIFKATKRALESARERAKKETSTTTQATTQPSTQPAG